MPANSQNDIPASPPLERVFQVNDMKLSAQCWGVGSSIPVLALHGWMDNSASFHQLAPLLAGCEVLAPDMAGHGYSDHRSRHGAYNIWDDILDVLAIADQMEWDTFNILAHSRGAFVCLLLAAAMPERVNKVVMLDGILTVASDTADSPKQLGEYLRDQKQRYNKPSRVYAALADAVQTRAEKLGLNHSECLPLVARAMAPLANESGWVWRHDPRVAGNSAFKLTEQHQQAFLSAFQSQALLILAEDGFSKWPDIQERVASNPCITLVEHAGGHHMHMQKVHCESLSQRINALFQAD